MRHARTKQVLVQAPSAEELQSRLHAYMKAVDELALAKQAVEGAGKLLQFFEPDNTSPTERLPFIVYGVGAALVDCAEFMEKTIAQAEGNPKNALEGQK